MENRKDKKMSEDLTVGYIGTYYSKDSQGIYRFSFNEESGEMTAPELFYEVKNAKWVSLHGDLLSFPIEKDGKAGTCFLELSDRVIKSSHEVLEERKTPCYIKQEGAFAYTANYHEGTVMIYHLTEGKPSVVKRIENGNEAGCHQILLHESYLMVPCLNQDRIRLFDKVNEFLPAGEIGFPKGSGPRHGLFNQAHTKLYVVSELSNELFIFKVRDKEFFLEQTISVLPEGQKVNGRSKEAASAAIRLTEDERFLYISIRGQELLAVIDVSYDEAVIIQHVYCGGNHPRDFILSSNEKFLIVANRLEGGIVSMERDTETGKIKNIKNRIDMPEGVSVILE